MIDFIMGVIGSASVLTLFYCIDTNIKLDKQIKQIEQWQRNQKR
jgi:hypothetical protein